MLREKKIMHLMLLYLPVCCQ